MKPQPPEAGASRPRSGRRTRGSFERLAPRDLRALVFGGGVLLILTGSFKALPAWLAWRAETLQVAAELSLELERTRVTISGLETSLDSAEARIARFSEMGSALLVTQGQAETAAALTDVIRGAARLLSVDVMAIETRVDTAGRPWLHRAIATVQATGDVTGLAALLQRLEGPPTLLAMRELYVQAQSVETPRDAIETLTIRFSVEGLALVPPSQ